METDLSFRSRRIVIREDGLQPQDFSSFEQLHRLDDCLVPAIDGWNVSHKQGNVIMTQEAYDKYEQLLRDMNARITGSSDDWWKN